MNVTGGLFNWAVFRDPAYTIYCMAVTICFLGLYTSRFRFLVVIRIT